MDKIKMLTPVVELDGDEMTRVIWQWIKDVLIFPYVDLKSEYYDLSLVNREATKDQVTKDAAAAIDRLGVGVKCATITPNAQRMTEYSLSSMWKSPNGTIRAALDGTVFREPIMASGISPLVPAWTSPIIIARHAYGDVYKDVEALCPKGSKAELVITSEGEEKRILIADYVKSGGVALGMHNLDSSIRSFAKSCFNYALTKGLDLWFSSKNPKLFHQNLLRIVNIQFRLQSVQWLLHNRKNFKCEICGSGFPVFRIQNRFQIITFPNCTVWNHIFNGNIRTSGEGNFDLERTL